MTCDTITVTNILIWLNAKVSLETKWKQNVIFTKKFPFSDEFWALGSVVEKLSKFVSIINFKEREIFIL